LVTPRPSGYGLTSSAIGRDEVTGGAVWSSSVIGLQSPVSLLAYGLGVSLLLFGLVVLFVLIKYTPVICRIFQERPRFMPLKVRPTELGETVEFRTDDGLRLGGSYLRARTVEQLGVIVYCHEFLSDRWSFRPYVDHLRDLGYDLFTFDFRNHGASDPERGYEPTQWTSDREVSDLRAALHYLRTRPDHDPAGFGLFGVSRGGTTALLAAAEEDDVWGIVTDGAFPTHGTMLPYIIRWAEIYVRSPFLRKLIPGWLYRLLSLNGRRYAEQRLNCRFPSVEAAAARLGPRPWLMIHGERDGYIGPEIARGLFEFGKNPRELWLVPEAGHNACRESDPAEYDARLWDFLERFAPRRPAPAETPVRSVHAELPGGFASPLAPVKQWALGSRQ
jgi:pimeloyl-ACP methyl ester carboxylesterase